MDMVLDCDTLKFDGTIFGIVNLRFLCMYLCFHDINGILVCYILLAFQTGAQRKESVLLP